MYAAVLLMLIAVLVVATPWSLAISVSVLLTAGRDLRRLNALGVVSLFILAGSLVGFLVTPSFAASLDVLAGIAAAVASGVLLVRLWARIELLLPTLAALIAVAALVALVSAMQVDSATAKLADWNTPFYAWFAKWPHLADIGFSQNATAAFLVLVLPFAVTALLHQHRLPGRVVYGLVIVWLMVSAAVTLSRGAYVALGAAFGVLLFWEGGRWRLLTPIPVLVTLATLRSGVTGYAFTISTTPTGWSSDDRLYIWHVALRMLADYAFTGIGPGAFPLRFAAYSWPSDTRFIPHAHNFLLQTWLDSGLLGLLGLLALALALLQLVCAVRGSALTPTLKREAGAAVASLVGVMAHGSVDAYFWGDPRTFFVVVIPIAVLVRVAQTATNEPGVSAGAARLRSANATRTLGLAKATLVVVSLGCLLGVARPLASLALVNAAHFSIYRCPNEQPGCAAATLLRLATAVDGRNGVAWQDSATGDLARGQDSRIVQDLHASSADGLSDALYRQVGTEWLTLTRERAMVTFRLLH